MNLHIDGVEISNSSPTYFMADIASNHDGDLKRAKELIRLAAGAGANAAKFQHFKADTIVSDAGFKSLGSSKSHQAQWKKSVFEVYQQASLNFDWTMELKETCDSEGIIFLTSPYDFDMVDMLDPFVPAYKIGSGDITWLEMIEKIAQKSKPYFIATGASSMKDVQRAMEVCLPINQEVCLMQCNTNYTGSSDNFSYVNLNVLRTYREMYPEVLLGLSDHTPGHSAVLGAVTLGARVIEKHFTDDQTRNGPDHSFSLNPVQWKNMVMSTRELESALGSNIKKVEDNESETVVLQRRAIYAKMAIEQDESLTRDKLIQLRPCPEGAIEPYAISEILGKKLGRSLKQGERLSWSDLL